MTLPASGQIDFGSIYTEYYKTVAPSTEMDMKELSLLYQGVSTVDASLSYFQGFEAVQAQLWRFADPWTGTLGGGGTFHIASDSCTNSDNNMLASSKYSWSFILEPSFGGYNGGNIDVSIRVDASLIFAGTGTDFYTQNIFIRCSSNGGTTYNVMAQNTFGGTANRAIALSGVLNLNNVPPGTNNLKFQLEHSMSPPSSLGWNTYLQNLTIKIENVHNDQALKTTRLFNNSFGNNSKAIELRYVSGSYDFLNWDLAVS
jgi:hypothetical protein